MQSAIETYKKGTITAKLRLGDNLPCAAIKRFVVRADEKLTAYVELEISGPSTGTFYRHRKLDDFRFEFGPQLRISRRMYLLNLPQVSPGVQLVVVLEPPLADVIAVVHVRNHDVPDA